MKTTPAVAAGLVDEVYNLPTTDAIEILKKSGSKVLIPFNRETIADVSLEEGRVTLSTATLEELL